MRLLVPARRGDWNSSNAKVDPPSQGGGSSIAQGANGIVQARRLGHSGHILNALARVDEWGETGFAQWIIA